jgi:hypothetical protein
MPRVTYEQAERTVKKKAVYGNFIARYRRFKANHPLPSETVFLPPCLYLSPQEVALNENK